jgi:hypothetical protein
MNDKHLEKDFRRAFGLLEKAETIEVLVLRTPDGKPDPYKILIRVGYKTRHGNFKTKILCFEYNSWSDYHSWDLYSNRVYNTLHALAFDYLKDFLQDIYSGYPIFATKFAMIKLLDSLGVDYPIWSKK